MNSTERRSNWGRRMGLLILLTIGCSGCPAPTPRERMEQLDAQVIDRGDGVVDLDLSDSDVQDGDVGYIHGFSSNSHSRWKQVHTLDLSNTAVSDAAIEFMVMQNPFCPPEGLKVIILTNTRVSPPAIESFRTKYPNCEVRH